MKQFLIPQPKQTYTIARDFSFLLYPFNLSNYGKEDHPFKEIYSTILYGKIDKKGKFKHKMDLVHGPSTETHEYSTFYYRSDKERMSLRECFVVVDSEEEKTSKFAALYQDKSPEWILGNVPKEITYCILTDFLNNSENKSYTIPYPFENSFKGYEASKFSRVVKKIRIAGSCSFLSTKSSR